jgi:cytochrome P450
VDILDEMMRLSLRIASRTLFSADLSDETGAIGRAYRTAFAYISDRMNSLVRVPSWVPTPHNLAFRRAKWLLDRVVLELIETRQQATTQPDDLLSLLLAAQDDETGKGITYQQVKDEILTLLTAGHETVETALSWAWYLLASAPGGPATSPRRSSRPAARTVPRR